MTQYLVAIHHPDDYDPSVEDEAMSRDIDALNDEMVAADVRIFVGGLSSASSARSLRAQPANTPAPSKMVYLTQDGRRDQFSAASPENN
jgi:hypothetical protein